MSSAVRSVWPCVRLLQVLGLCWAVRSVWPCSAVTRVSSRVWLFQVFGPVFGCFLVAGRVFGCYKSLAVRSAVTIFWPCGRLLQALAVRLAVLSVGQLFLRFSTCLGLSPFIFSLVPSFSLWELLFCSCMFFLTLIYFLGRSLFFYICCVFILLCFRRDFLFSLFPSFPRGFFLAFLRLSVERTSLSSLCLVFSPLGIVGFFHLLICFIFYLCGILF